MHSPRSVLALALIGLAALTWPYWSGLQGPPNDLDGVVWITRSSVSQADWWRWVFATRHFQIGFRPITALTFVLDDLAGGSLLVYRLTDLALHVAVCLAVAGLFRALFPERPRAGAWLAAGIVALHPTAERVVPVLANRSYSLAALLCTLSLTLGCRSVRLRIDGKRATGSSLACGALAAGALLANEVAIVGIAFLPFALARARGTAAPAWRQLMRPLAVVIAFVLVALAWRLSVVGGLGGYRLLLPRSARALAIFRAVWSQLASFRPGPGVLTASHGILLLCLALPYYASRVSAVRVRSPGLASLRAGLVLWIAAYSLLYATQGIWFERQLYIVSIPLALLAADVLLDTLAQPCGRARRMLHLVPQLVLLTPILLHSPALVGPDANRVTEAARRAASLEQLERTIGECREPAVVRLVLPYSESTRIRMPRDASVQSPLPREALIPSAWLRHRVRTRDLVLQEFIYYDADAGTCPGVEGVGDGVEVVLPPGRPYVVPSRFGNDVRDGSASRRVAARSWPLPRDRAAYLLVHGMDPGRLVPLSEAPR